MHVKTAFDPKQSPRFEHSAAEQRVKIFAIPPFCGLTEKYKI